MVGHIVSSADAPALAMRLATGLLTVFTGGVLASFGWRTFNRGLRIDHPNVRARQLINGRVCLIVGAALFVVG